MLVLGGIVMIFVGAATGRPQRNVPAPILVGVLYLFLGALYIFPANYLNRFASRIRSLVAMRRTLDLEDALEAQRAFWKFCGIMAIVVMALYLAFIAIAVFGRL